jgi:RimJ/RimL family protein N-acetyltransferase
MHLPLKTCEIRDWRSEDAAPLVRHANDREVSKNLRDEFPFPYTEADAGEWICYATGEGRGAVFALAIEGEAVGGIGLRPGTDINRRTAEIGFWLGRKFWGRGIMTEVVEALTRYAFDHMELDRIFAAVFEGNTASMRVLEKAGYRREGRMHCSAVKDGRSLDQILFAAVRP